ncbi:hypothetical protein K0U07_01860 [bacterium]|nr:hypothetical protein [bacterium]
MTIAEIHSNPGSRASTPTNDHEDKGGLTTRVQHLEVSAPRPPQLLRAPTTAISQGELDKARYTANAILAGCVATPLSGLGYLCYAVGPVNFAIGYATTLAVASIYVGIKECIKLDR